MGSGPSAIAITPDGTKAYVANLFDATVTEINLTTNTPAATISLQGLPDAVAISPDGSTAYVPGESGSDNVTPIDVATKSPRRMSPGDRFLTDTPSNALRRLVLTESMKSPKQAKG